MVSRNSRSRRPAFTLIELLVVVAIITLILAILLPSLSRARDRARAGACLANMHGIMTAINVYAADNDSHLPPATTTSLFYLDTSVTPNVNYTQTWGYGYNTGASQVTWDPRFGYLSPYFPHRGAVQCPSAPLTMKPAQNSPFNTGVGLTTPNPPVTVYQMAKWAKTSTITGIYASAPRLADFSRPATTAVFGETATLASNAASPAGLNGLMETGGVFSDVIAGLAAGSVGPGGPTAVVPDLLAQHAKQGTIGWADGHASLESPWFCYSTAFEGNAARIAALQTYNFGWLSPTQLDPTTATVASIKADPISNDYFVITH